MENNVIETRKLVNDVIQLEDNDLKLLGLYNPKSDSFDNHIICGESHFDLNIYHSIINLKENFWVTFNSEDYLKKHNIDAIHFVTNYVNIDDIFNYKSGIFYCEVFSFDGDDFYFSDIRNSSEMNRLIFNDYGISESLFKSKSGIYNFTSFLYEEKVHGNNRLKLLREKMDRSGYVYSRERNFIERISYVKIENETDDEIVLTGTGDSKGNISIYIDKNDETISKIIINGKELA